MSPKPDAFEQFLEAAKAGEPIPLMFPVPSAEALFEVYWRDAGHALGEAFTSPMKLDAEGRARMMDFIKYGIKINWLSGLLAPGSAAMALVQRLEASGLPEDRVAALSHAYYEHLRAGAAAFINSPPQDHLP